MKKEITLEDLRKAGGLEFRIIYPEPLDVLECKKIGTWPDEVPVPGTLALIGQREYAISARELAEKLGTTPRQISKLRSGRVRTAKPLTWYKENNMTTGL